MLRLTYGVLRDGRNIQSGAKFQLNIYIYIIFIFSCKSGAFLGVAVLTAKGAYSVDSGCLDSNGKQSLPASKYDVFEISFFPVVNKCNCQYESFYT